MRAKKIIGYTLIVILVVIASIWTLDWKSYASQISAIASTAGAKAGFAVKITGEKLSPLSFSANKIELASISLPTVELALSNIKGRINWLSLATAKKTFSVKADAYGGALESAFTFLPEGVNYSLRLDRLALEKYPLFSELGLTGLLFIDCKDLEQKRGGFSNGECFIQLKNCSKAAPLKHHLNSLGIPLSVEIPSFSALNLTSSLSLKGGSLLIKSLSLDSSLLSAKGKGEIKSFSKSPAISASLAISLSDEGLKRIGSFLPLISRGVLPNTRKSFTVKISGRLSNPSINFK
ncbi:MAG: type II secretion system protein GspN [Candidatus Dadabacteria bacterium]|nr:MAG: type II secretion system protein GspN [Candidatus Dadabacteria bacterium]